MKKRIFIAINLPDSAKKELNNLISQTKKINPSQSIRYVRAKTIHLTLHFLGDLDLNQIKKVKKVILDISHNYSQNYLTTEKIDAFPNLKNPKIIFLSCKQKQGNSLSSLQKNLGKNLEKINIDVDHRTWRPHLTLARIKGPCHFKTENISIPKLQISVKSVEIMESNLSTHGAKYKIIESYTLKK